MVSSLSACLQDDPVGGGGGNAPVVISLVDNHVGAYKYTLDLGSVTSYDTKLDGLSAISLNEAGDGILIARDNGDVLEYDLNGNLQKTNTMPNPDGRSKVDLEGITRSPDGSTIYLCEERFREVYSLNADHKGFTLLSTGPQETGAEDNQGYEGIAAGAGGVLYVANQSKPFRVYTYNTGTKAWATAFDISEAKSLSDIFYDNEDGSLWITDAKTQKLSRFQLNGNQSIVEMYDISFVSKPEGFCKDPAHKLFLFVCDKTNKIFKVSYQ